MQFVDYLATRFNRLVSHFIQKAFDLNFQLQLN